MKKLQVKKLSMTLLSLLLCSATVFMAACDGCGKKKQNESSSSSSSSPSGSNGGDQNTGDDRYQSTDGFVVPADHSKCEYKILIPAGTRDENTNIAIEELQYGIEMTTGYVMPTTTVYEAGKKYLSVGKTALYEANKAEIEGDSWKYTDVRILTDGDNVIMAGGNTESTCYAVYDFMEISFGFKWYSPFDYDVEPSQSISLYDFDYKDTPDITRRNLYEWEYWAADASASVPWRKRNRRMKVQEFEEDYVVSGHTVITMIMKHSLYYDQHPEWYTVAKDEVEGIDNGQLCLTNEELVQAFIERCKEMILAKPDMNHMQLGMEDNWDYCKGLQYNEDNRHKCTCVESARANSASGGDGDRTGNFIIFANKVSRAINEWIKEEFNDPNREMKFTIYAYFHNLNAPVKKDANGNYVPVNENVIPDDNISIMYAPLNNDFTYSIDDPRNETISRMLKEWGALTPNIYMYSYGCAYGAGSLYPMNDLTTMGGSYAYAGQAGFYGYLDEAQTYYRTPCMQRLKDYIRSQMWWDTTLSVDDLAFEFIDFYYRPVAEEFKAYYKAFKQFQIYQIAELGLKVPIMSATYGDARYWPKDAIDSFVAQIDGILAKLEPLKKENPDKYQEYFDRINIEKIWMYNIYLESYPSSFNVSTRREMIDFMELYCTKYNVCMRKVPELIAKWREAL